MLNCVLFHRTDRDFVISIKEVVFRVIGAAESYLFSQDILIVLLYRLKDPYVKWL
jgi:hypothetical protein